jgi:hypothetical protein
VNWLNGPAGEEAAILLTLGFVVIGVVLVVALEVLVVWDGMFHMLERRQSVLDRILHRRLPVTESDFVLHGAFRVFGSIGTFLFLVPIFLNAIVLLADVLGIIRGGGIFAMIVLVGGAAICWPIGIALGVSAAVLYRKVHFTQLGARI